MAKIKNIKIYDMNHEKRGIALVINISKYDSTKDKKPKERVWSKKDVENLTHTLKKLEFDLIKEENLTKSELENLLDEQTEKSHENYDCFLCVVMSHGIDDHIVTRDNQLIRFDEIMAPIMSCSTLIDKPKLFFFQACRGYKKLESILWEQPSPVSQSRTSSANSIKSSQIAHMTDPNYRNKFPKLPQIKKSIIPNNKSEYESDLLVFYSTLPDHLSWSRNPLEETIFIKSVCDVFNTAYNDIPNNLSLAQMFNKINNEISSKIVIIHDADGHKEIVQVAVYETTIKGEVYFLPKNVNVIFFTKSHN
jgi:hypothetical protein